MQGSAGVDIDEDESTTVSEEKNSLLEICDSRRHQRVLSSILFTGCRYIEPSEEVYTEGV